MHELLQAIKAEGRVIRSAPWSFLVAVAVVGAMIWWAIDTRYSDRLDSVRQDNALYKDKAEAYDKIVLGNVTVREQQDSIRKKLKEFYIAGGDLLQRKITSDEQVERFKKDAMLWLLNTKEWIEKNMSKAALARFEFIPDRMTMKGKNDYNADHWKYKTFITFHRENLQALIESDSWR